MQFEEFEQFFWDYIGKNIVSSKDLNYKNTEFCDAVCYDCYRIYTRSNVDVNIICKMAENMLFSVKRFNPKLSAN